MGWQRHSSGDDLKRIAFAYKKAFKIDQESVLFLDFTVPQNRPRHIQVRAEGYTDYLEVGEISTTGDMSYYLKDDRGLTIDLNEVLNDILVDDGLTLDQIQLQNKPDVVSKALNKVSRIYGSRTPK